MSNRFDNLSQREKQKKVLSGVLQSSVFMGFFYYYFYVVFPFDVPVFDSFVDKLIFTLQWNTLPVLSLLFGIIVMASSRFLTPAIDPLAGKESKRQEVYLRYISNTFQQCFLFLFTTLALATLIPDTQIKIMPVLAILFVLGRILFLIGYLTHPLCRAHGMFMNEMVTYLPLIYVGWQVIEKFF